MVILKVKLFENLEVFYTLGSEYILNTKKKFYDTMDIKKGKKKLYISNDDINNFIIDTICCYKVKFPDNLLSLNKNFLNLETRDYNDNNDLMAMNQIKLRLFTTYNYLLNSKNYKNIIIRNYVVNMIILKLVFSKTTKPEYVYFKARKNDFNNEYDLNISYQFLDKVMNSVYSKNNLDYVRLFKINNVNNFNIGYTNKKIFR